MSDPMFEPAKIKDYIKAGVAAIVLSTVLYCSGYRPVFATEQSSYSHINSECDGKREQRKYVRGLEKLTTEELEWMSLKVDYEKNIDLNLDGVIDTVELHSRVYQKGCDINDWPFKDNYLRLHLSEQQDLLLDWKGGLPQNIRIDVHNRTINIDGVDYEKNEWNKKVTY